MDVWISGSGKRVGYKILSEENLGKASVIITDRSKTISCTGVLIVKFFVPLWINRIRGAPWISFCNESCTFLINESLRVSDIKRGEPKKIFACQGEGRGQLRVTMITYPHPCKGCETKEGRTQILLSCIYFLFNYYIHRYNLAKFGCQGRQSLCPLG